MNHRRTTPVVEVDNSAALVEIRDEIRSGFVVSFAQHTALAAAGSKGFAVRVGRVLSVGGDRNVYFGVTTRQDAPRWHQLRQDEREFAETLVRLGFTRGFGCRPLANALGIEWYLTQRIEQRQGLVSSVRQRVWLAMVDR